LLVFTATGLIGLLSLASLPTLWLTFRHPEGINIRKVGKTMEMVTLRTGKIVPEPVVATTMIALHTLAQQDQTALYELVELCEKDEKIFWTRARETLLSLALIQSGDRVSDYVRDIVMATVKFGTSSVKITNPIADSE
jgi:hypothetical protein